MWALAPEGSGQFISFGEVTFWCPLTLKKVACDIQANDERRTTNDKPDQLYSSRRTHYVQLQL